MTHDTSNRFDSRLNRAAEAKQAALQKFKEQQALLAANAQARQEERIKIQQARAEREAERAKLRAEEAKLAEQAAREQADHDAARALELAAEQKAKRDARYAARKARNG